LTLPTKLSLGLVFLCDIKVTAETPHLSNRVICSWPVQSPPREHWTSLSRFFEGFNLHFT